MNDEEWKNMKEKAKSKYADFKEISENEIEFFLKAFKPMDLDMFEEKVRIERISIGIPEFDGKIIFKKEVEEACVCPTCKRETDKKVKVWKNCSGEIIQIMKEQEEQDLMM